MDAKKMHMSSCDMQSRHVIVFVYSYISCSEGVSLQLSRLIQQEEEAEEEEKKRSHTLWLRKCLEGFCRVKSDASHAIPSPIS